LHGRIPGEDPMIRLLLSAVVLCAVAGVVVLANDRLGGATKTDSCCNKKADKPADKTGIKAATKPATKPAGPINKFCPVERENPVDAIIPTVTYEGKVIGFCCDDCVPKFKKDPKTYMKDLK